jgi:hypothetical protein
MISLKPMQITVKHIVALEPNPIMRANNANNSEEFDGSPHHLLVQVSLLEDPDKIAKPIIVISTPQYSEGLDGGAIAEVLTDALNNQPINSQQVRKSPSIILEQILNKMLTGYHLFTKGKAYNKNPYEIITADLYGNEAIIDQAADVASVLYVLGKKIRNDINNNITDAKYLSKVEAATIIIHSGTFNESNSYIDTITFDTNQGGYINHPNLTAMPKSVLERHLNITLPTRPLLDDDHRYSVTTKVQNRLLQMPIIPTGNVITLSAFHGTDRVFSRFKAIENAGSGMGRINGIGTHCTTSFAKADGPSHFKRSKNITNPNSEGCFIYDLSITANENDVVKSSTLIKDLSPSLQMALIEQYPEYYSTDSKVHDLYCNLSADANTSVVAINSMFIKNGIKVITNIFDDRQGGDTLLVLDDSVISIQYIKKKFTEDGAIIWADIKESTQELSLTD